MDVVVTEFGVSLGKKSERLIVRRNGSVLEEHPLFDVSHVIISSNGVSLSSDLVRECAQAGIPISFLSRSGKPLARLSSPEMAGTVETRRLQMTAYFDIRGVSFALAITRAKIANQSATLKYFGKSRKEAHPELHSLLHQAAKRVSQIAGQLDLESLLPDEESPERVDFIRASVLSIEGRAGRAYWEALRQIIPPELGFLSREHQGATDLTNSLLNYGYGILYQQVWGAIVLAGLDPFAGFLHVDRPGKPSLVLDMVEEFRQTVVDRTVFGLLTKGVVYKMTEEGRLADEARQEFARRILDRLDSPVRFEGKRERLRAVIQKQARHLACFFRGERDY
ncbi:MAG: CRISPR-associated endonuclease Cas1, partial [Blastocatellia bacterium]